ncbi:hypothetical protein ACIA8G_02375 [Lentzea sp. NPDC051213]|uniref:hypothetical protein n=1 Tax=Lentzea sp. NPDC051213 TaxID=3364126 RepID=UPI0037B6ECF0
MIAGKVVRAALTACAASAVTLAQLNLPEKSFWDARSVVLYLSVTVLAITVVHDATIAVTHALQANQIKSYGGNLNAAFAATVTSVVTEFGTPWDEIAVTFYRSKLFGRWRKLIRVGGVRAGARPINLNPYIRTRTGIVGHTFTEQAIIAAEWKDFVESAVSQGKSAWEQRRPQDRYGLSWGELMRAERPDGIVAQPIFNERGRPVGCASITGPLKLVDMNSPQMGQILNDLATAMYLIGPTPRGWWSFHG